MVRLTDEQIEKEIGEELRHIYSGHVKEYYAIRDTQLRAVVEDLEAEAKKLCGMYAHGQSYWVVANTVKGITDRYKAELEG